MMLNVSKHWNPTERLVTSAKTGSVYRMVSATKIDPSEEQLANLTSICNQKAIYEFLFREQLKGQPYGLEKAQSFFTWAANGWKEQSYFVFSLVAQNGLIAGVLDIKSANRSMAEIGYWCSEEHRGLMSGAVSELKTLAREAGFKALFALVRTDNAASRRVLENNGFDLKGEDPKNTGRQRFEVRLPR